MARLFTRASAHRIQISPGAVTGALWANRTVVAIVRRASNQGASLARVFTSNYASDINGAIGFGGATADRLSITTQTVPPTR